MQWGIDRAGEQGVSVYTESTPAGAVVYKKLGFVKLKDVKVLEGDIDHSVTAFIKRPKHQKP